MTKKHKSGDTNLQEFAARFNKVLDVAGVARKGKGRQVEVAKALGLSAGGARKLLEGESEPISETQRSIVSWLKTRGININLNWLVAGEGEMTTVKEAEYKALNVRLLETAIRESINELKKAGIQLDDVGIAKFSAMLYGHSISNPEKSSEIDRAYMSQLIEAIKAFRKREG